MSEAGCPHAPASAGPCGQCNFERRRADDETSRLETVVHDLAGRAAEEKVAATLDDFDAAFTVWVERARREVRGIVETVLRTRLTR